MRAAASVLSSFVRLVLSEKHDLAQQHGRAALAETPGDALEEFIGMMSPWIELDGEKTELMSYAGHGQPRKFIAVVHDQHGPKDYNTAQLKSIWGDVTSILVDELGYVVGSDDMCHRGGITVELTVLRSGIEVDFFLV